jgi:hypothetical protein
LETGGIDIVMKKTFYFAHDFNARNDEKITLLRMKHGMLGYGVYFAILERLGEATDYAGVADYNIIAYDLRVDASVVKSVINDFGLFAFTANGECFYSESLIRRMKPLESLQEQRRKAGIKSAEKRKNASSPESKNSENATDVQRTFNGRSTTVEENVNGRCEKNQQKKKIKENKEKPSNEGKKKVQDVEREKDAATAATPPQSSFPNSENPETPAETDCATPTEKTGGGLAVTQEERKKKSVQELEKREKDFYNSLKTFVGQYSKEMVRAFYDYWTEKNRSGTKMRFELEKTWDVSLRLATWSRNDKNFNKNENEKGKGKQTVVIQP